MWTCPFVIDALTIILTTMKRLIPLVYDFDFKVMLTLLHGIVVLNHSAQAMAVK